MDEYGWTLSSIQHNITKKGYNRGTFCANVTLIVLFEDEFDYARLCVDDDDDDYDDVACLNHFYFIIPSWVRISLP